MPRKGENVYHRKDGLWEARYVKEIDEFGKKKYGSVYGHSCREAKEKRQQIVDNIRLFQKPVCTRNTTVYQLAEEWLHLCQSKLKLSTYQRYRGFLENHIIHIGNLPVIFCSSATLQNFVFKLVLHHKQSIQF